MVRNTLMEMRTKRGSLSRDYGLVSSVEIYEAQSNDPIGWSRLLGQT